MIVPGCPKVLGDLNRSGKSRQRALLRSTHRMPSQQARSSAGGRPPLRLDFAPRQVRLDPLLLLVSHFDIVSLGHRKSPLNDRLTPPCAAFEPRVSLAP
jgi:hypothetical protein